MRWPNTDYPLPSPPPQSGPLPHSSRRFVVRLELNLILHGVTAEIAHARYFSRTEPLVCSNSTAFYGVCQRINLKLYYFINEGVSRATTFSKACLSQFVSKFRLLSFWQIWQVFLRVYIFSFGTERERTYSCSLNSLLCNQHNPKRRFMASYQVIRPSIQIA